MAEAPAAETGPVVLLSLSVAGGSVRLLLDEAAGDPLLPDLLIEPGVIYPLWGADHYFRTPQVSPLFYRLLRSVRLHWLEG